MLQGLEAKSLLRRTASGRYELHELLRQYAAEKLQARPQEAEAIQALHASYYAAFLHQREAHLKGRQQQTALEEIGAELDNIRMTWRWATERKAIEVIDRSLESLAIYRELGLPSGIALCLSDLGGMCCALGEYTEAQELLQESLAIRREISDRKGVAYSLQFLGNVAEALGAYATAEQHYQESLALFREIGDTASESGTLSGLGRLYHYLGDDETARAHGQQAVRITEDLGERHMQGYALTSLGHALAGLRRLAEARDAYQQAVDVRRAVGQPDLAMEAVAGLARVSLAQGDPPQALVHVEEILNHLANDTLDAAVEPCLAYLTCYHVLQAGQDPRAPAVLEAAHTLLQERAARIQDKAQRRSYLENVPFHREIVRAWAEAGNRR